MAEKGAKRSRRKISNHTATTISDQDDVEENMLIEILCRLPTAASAIRLKLVCRRWCSLISTPYFVKTFIDIHNRYHDSDGGSKYQKPFGFLLTHVHPFHALNLKSTVAMFANNSSFNFQDFSLSRNIPEQKHDVIVVASCNDLILCLTGMMRRNKSYFLCNPFTKQWVALPSPPSPVTTDIRSEFGLLCEEAYCCGDVMNSLFRYRIVRFSYTCHFKPGSLIAVETYYSETGRWVESDSLGEVARHRMASNIVAYNGKLCWIDAGRRVLVTYDPFNIGHRRRRIPLKDDLDLYQPSHKDVYKLRIGVSGGVLRIIRLGNIDEGRPLRRLYYTVWDLEEVMAGGGERWMRMRLKHEMEDVDSFCNEGATHPTNKDVVYFYPRGGHIYREYNMESREMKTGAPLQHRRVCFSINPCQIFSVEIPWWPTPLLDRSSTAFSGQCKKARNSKDSLVA